MKAKKQYDSSAKNRKSHAQYKILLGKRSKRKSYYEKILEICMNKYTKE